MTNQRDYNILLGYGTGTQTIANFGCFMIAAYDALKKRNLYTGSVGQWNQHLKEIGVYTPANPTMISVVTLGANSKYFTQGYKEAYSDAGLIKYLSQPDKYIVIGEVSAKGIGGTGQHFVKVIKVDSQNGKISMTYIDDPWGGLDNQKITTRYGTYGNVLSLRVLELAKGTTDMSTLYPYLGVANDAEAKTKLKEHLGEKDGKSEWGSEQGEGGHLGAARREIAKLRTQTQTYIEEIAQQKDLTTVAVENEKKAKEALTNEQAAHQKTKTELAATKQLLLDCQNKPITPPAETSERGRLNGYTKTYVKEGVAITENYAIDR